jgi:hypothetical protein
VLAPSAGHMMNRLLSSSPPAHPHTSFSTAHTSRAHKTRAGVCGKREGDGRCGWAGSGEGAGEDDVDMERGTRLVDCMVDDLLGAPKP